jgi:sugar lactone lactonase YvrE
MEHRRIRARSGDSLAGLGLQSSLGLPITPTRHPRPLSSMFAHIIWRFSPNESRALVGQASAWVPTNPLLVPNNGVPSFGANGIEFNKAQNAMFVCNTAMDWIVEIPVTGRTPGRGGTPGTPVVFTNSINGCDGIAIDSSDNIWAAANQADEIVVVDPTGKVIAKLGDFDGVNGARPRVCCFPQVLPSARTASFFG